MCNMTTTTLRELRHNFGSVEKAARRGPMRITRRDRVIGTFTAATRAAKNKTDKWTPPDRTARGIRTNGPVDVLDFLDR